jgi:hypothetical protein
MIRGKRSNVQNGSMSAELVRAVNHFRSPHELSNPDLLDVSDVGDELERQVAPLRAVYQTLVNVDRRPDWLEGVDTINREMTSERINMRHNCVFHGMTLVNTAVYRDFSENHARYSEKVEIPEINLALLAHYEMEALGEASTRPNFNVNWMGTKLPAEKKQGMMAGQATNFELFKHVCETNPA